MIDRRHFMIGAGALLTASFVRRASAFSAVRAGRPLIVPAVQGAGGDALRLLASRQRGRQLAGCHLGRTQPLRRRLRDVARASAQPCPSLETDDEIERVLRKGDLPVDDLDTRLNRFGWEDRMGQLRRPPGQRVPNSCSRASIWVPQDQRLGRPARSSFRSSGVSRQLLHLG